LIGGSKPSGKMGEVAENSAENDPNSVLGTIAFAMTSDLLVSQAPPYLAFADHFIDDPTMRLKQF
jgi:hypothetical protein